jgi:hypothetical protein
VSIFTDAPAATMGLANVELVVGEDLSLIGTMNVLAEQLREIPEGRRLMRLGLVRLGEQAIVAQLTANGLSLGPRVAALAVQAEIWYVMTVSDIMSRYELSPRVRNELALKADMIFVDLDTDLRTICRLANREIAKIIIRSLATERPLSFLDRLLY